MDTQDRSKNIPYDLTQQRDYQCDATPIHALSRRKFLSLSAIAAGSAVLAACGGTTAATPTSGAVTSATSVQPSAAPTAVTGAAPTAASAQPSATSPQGSATGSASGARRGGSITMAVANDWVIMDPHKASAFASIFAWEQTYQSLVTFDEKLQILPALATSWQVNDPLNWTFKLRQGVLFHNGDEFTADDVVYWKDRLFDPATAAPYKTWFDPITKVEAVDKYTVKIQLQAPYAPLLANLASMRGSAIVPHKATQTDFTKEAIGTGPYKLTNIAPKGSYRWEMNTNYWDSNLPYIATADNKLLPEEAAQLAAIQSGAAAYTWLTGESTKQITNKNLNVLIGEKAFYYHMQMNCSRAPLSDKRVRQAIGLAINHQEIIDKVVGGFGVLTGPVPTGHTDWYIPVDKLPYKVDIPAAKKLLADANLANGFKTTYKANSGDVNDVATAQVIKEQLKQIGIDVEIIQLDTTRWNSETQPPKSDYDLRLNANTFYPDADGYLYNHYYSMSGFNQTRFNSPQLDSLVTKARQLTDHEERRQIYFQVQNLLLDEMPVVPLWNGKNIEALSPKLKGYRQSYTGRRLFFSQTWLES